MDIIWPVQIKLRFIRQRLLHQISLNLMSRPIRWGDVDEGIWHRHWASISYTTNASQQSPSNVKRHNTKMYCKTEYMRLWSARKLSSAQNTWTFAARLWLTPWKSVSLEKLTVTQLVKNSLPFKEPEGSLWCSKEPATKPYHETVESSPHPHISLL
jgi:hypothetical protein